MTTLDLTNIAPKARARYIQLGRRFGSDDTLKQANKTLEALKTHAGELEDHGFGAVDGQRLTDARDALSAANAGRETKVTEKKTSRNEYLAASSRAKTARSTARTILENTLNRPEGNAIRGSAHVAATYGQGVATYGQGVATYGQGSTRFGGFVHGTKNGNKNAAQNQGGADEFLGLGDIV